MILGHVDDLASTAFECVLILGPLDLGNQRHWTPAIRTVRIHVTLRLLRPPGSLTTATRQIVKWDHRSNPKEPRKAADDSREVANQGALRRGSGETAPEIALGRGGDKFDPKTA